MQKKMRYKIFCDTETTGFPEKGGWLGNDLLTWSAIVADEDLEIVEKITVYSRPTNISTWSDEAEKHHGISFYDAMNFPEQSDAMENIANFVHPYMQNFDWVEHSLNWIDWLFTRGLFYKENNDNGFYYLFKEAKRESTIKMARSKGYKANSLDIWSERIGFKLKHHNSESDAMACLEIYKHLIRNETQPKNLLNLMGLG